MYVFVVYDVGEKRVSKIMKICREYLDHIQNSVFEGEITSENYKELTSRLTKKINIDTDSIIIIELWDKSFKRHIIGVEKREKDNFL